MSRSNPTGAAAPLAPVPGIPTGTAARRDALRAHIRAHAENRPGVYRMLGPAGEILYIGKSRQVRTRLLSYFRAKRGEKAHEIVSHAWRIEWEYVPSEFAAILLEMRQIRHWRPPYNVEHKHDREYCFVKLTREPAPRLLVVNRVAEDRATYFGPFRGKRFLTEALRELADLHGLRTCAATTPIHFADQTDLFAVDRTPRCLRADLRRCLAPCAARCTRSGYRRRVDATRRFLEGEADRPLAILEARMNAAAERMHYEYAAELRDRAVRLRNVRDSLVSLRDSIETLSFAYHVPGYNGDDRVYLIRRGSIRAELPEPRTPAERDDLAACARAILATPEPALASVNPAQVPEILLIARWFRQHPAERERALQLGAVDAIRRSA